MITLPPAPKPRGNYWPALVHQGIVHVSGQVSRDDAETTLSGCVAPGDDLSRARAAARWAMLRCLSVLAAQVGGLDRVEQVLTVRGYVRSTPDFDDHTKVLDAASDVLVEALGAARGRHARAAVGVASLPSGGLVEIELSAALRT